MNPHGGDPATAARALGLAVCPEIRLDFSVNLNPLGPPPSLRRVLLNGDVDAVRYPHTTAGPAAAALASAHGLDADQVIVGNGSTELFGLILQCLKPAGAGVFEPCYAGYHEVCRACDVPVVTAHTASPENEFVLPEGAISDCEAELLFVGSPNNPTGRLVTRDNLLAAARGRADRTLVVDESFMDFVPDEDSYSLRGFDFPPNVIVVKSLTKFFCIAGLRLGMAWGRPSTIQRIRTAQLPWTVNGLAQAIAPTLYENGEYVARSRERTTELRVRFVDLLRSLPGVTVYPSHANFVLIRLPQEQPVNRLQRALMGDGILIRSCENFAGLGPAYCRLAVRPEREQDELVLALGAHLSGGRVENGRDGESVSKPKNSPHGLSSLCRSACCGDYKPAKPAAFVVNAVRRVGRCTVGLETAAGARPSRDCIAYGVGVGMEGPRTGPPSIMVVGTTSNAGKSVVAAALCRWLARRGVRVAPFKAQNMALNSYVTDEGGEMGRAQVTQAVAAGIQPHTDMNPVLLKPQGDDGSQVIVDGHPIATLGARDYYALKARMRKAAHDAYDRLAARYDCIVLEGAGSPAEINLMAEDFVNMDMADYVGARTVLVADIDRGGVFATILGTISLLPPHHRRLLVGIIINKFRGDVTLLASGIRDIEAMTGVPVLGVLPYLRNLRIEDEDSLGLETRPTSHDAVLDMVVIRLPRISNFTDFLAMETDEGVGVRYVESAEKLGEPDLIVLPGTKNTRSDLDWLRQSGLDIGLRKAREDGVPIFGICGGYQMLGRLVADPHGMEGDAGESEGLGFLPVTTELAVEKELVQVEGVTGAALPFAEPGTPFRGYEIHAGRTAAQTDGDAPLTIVRRRGAEIREPAGSVAGQVFGCYVHGLFYGPELRAALWRWLCERKGVPTESVQATEHSLMSEIDRMTDLLDAHVNLDWVPDVPGTGPDSA